MIVERGNFVGHFVPASFFLGFGTFFLLLTLKRCREVQHKANKDGSSSSSMEGPTTTLASSFADLHVPENPKVLLGSGIILILCTTVGFLIEAGGGLKDGLGLFYESGHEVMYASVLLAGTACCLEGSGRLYPNSHRHALSFTFLMQYLLWHEHALMLVEDAVAYRVHMIQAQMTLLASALFGYTAYSPRSMFAYVASWAVMLWNGTWMLTAGLTTCCVTITVRSIAAVLVLEALLIASTIVICAACLLDQRPPHHDGGKEGVGSRSDDEIRYRVTRRSSGGENVTESETTDIC